VRLDRGQDRRSAPRPRGATAGTTRARRAIRHPSRPAAWRSLSASARSRRTRGSGRGPCARWSDGTRHRWPHRWRRTRRPGRTSGAPTARGTRARSAPPRRGRTPACPRGRGCRPRADARSDLALLAVEGGAAADLLPHDRAAATTAGLALAVVDLVQALVVAHLAEHVAVLLVGQRRAPVLDRVLQRLDHGPVEPPHLLR